MKVFAKVVGAFMFIPAFIILMLFGLILFTNLLLSTTPH